MAGFEPAHTRVKVLCLNRLATPHRCPSEKKWGGRRDSNPRPSEPQSDILTRLNYAHHICFFRMNPHTHALAGFPPGERCVLGASAGIRTLDLRLRRPLLYPAELQAHSGVPVTHFNKDRRSCQLLFIDSAKKISICFSRSSSCISCRCRRGRGRYGPPGRCSRRSWTNGRPW